VALASCGGNDDSNKGFQATATRQARATAAPSGTAAATDGLPGVAFRTNGNAHINPGDAHGEYFSNPPTSGWHFVELPKPGIYETALAPEDVPHFMEHGGVWVLYNCPTPCTELVNQLIPIVNQATQANKPVALAPYTTMEKKIALVAWRRLDTLDAFDETRVKTFIDKMVCQYNPEGPGYCPNTVGMIDPAVDARTAPTVTPTPASTRKTYPTAPAMAIDTSKTYIATMTLAKGGEIKIELNAKAAPSTVNNFVFLAREGFYDGTTFHRVIKQPGNLQIAQGGDPKGDGTGGPGYTIPDEHNNGLKHDEGMIAMAKTSAPNSAGSQFYLTLGPNNFLDGNYTVFGKITSGLDVAKSITSRDPGPNAAPGDRIDKVTITEQ
jgi:peptidylprolyl isomerase